MTETDATRWILGTLVVLGVLLFAGPLLFGMGGGMTGGMWSGGTTGGMWGPMHDGWVGGGTTGGSAWWVFALLWRVLLLAVLVGGGYLLYRAAAGERTDSAIRELRSAYARGDISEEEYERRRERLENE